ncbi:hypothetical protein ACNR9Q_17150 [Maribacter sp. X9]|uniref:hypothetical protein n=1 Tax=Maribacter sp. X9 TaxID=3402159 RepID=UPI003AF39D42
METDKFEKHIREKLQDREIRPSSTAWERISGDLNTSSSPKKPVYLWMGIAASIVVLLGIGLFYFNGNKEEFVNPVQVVESTKKEEPENKAGQLKGQEAVVRSELKKEDFLDLNNAITESGKTVVEVSRPVIQDDVEVTILEQIEAENHTKKLKFTEQIITNKVSELVAQVDLMEQYNTVTDAEVDSLLKQAQEEILRNKIFKTDNSVDAMALLTEVEDELDQSFRDQIFNSLKAGFIKVRTAVADRNN